MKGFEIQIWEELKSSETPRPPQEPTEGDPKAMPPPDPGPAEAQDVGAAGPEHKLTPGSLAAEFQPFKAASDNTELKRANGGSVGTV